MLKRKEKWKEQVMAKFENYREDYEKCILPVL